MSDQPDCGTPRSQWGQGTVTEFCALLAGKTSDLSCDITAIGGSVSAIPWDHQYEDKVHHLPSVTIKSRD